MNCPRCDRPTRVLESRPAEDGAAIRRRRACTACGHRFTTFERCDPEPLVVRKRDGGEERFDPAKLRSALMRAAHKRPVSPADVQAIVGRAAGAIEAAGGELRTDRLAAFCLEQLERLDRGAYLQYAGTLPEPNAQFARSEAYSEAALSVRAESDHG